MRATQFPGVMAARWRRVPNFRFYEIQMAVQEQAGTVVDWDTITIRSTTVSSDTFPVAGIGQRMSVRVRTVGAKGPGPWSQEATVMVL